MRCTGRVKITAHATNSANAAAALLNAGTVRAPNAWQAAHALTTTTIVSSRRINRSEPEGTATKGEYLGNRMTGWLS
jgi:hypothetical protein